ncbi:VOC family protein [Mongoliitalea lutea]|uniref:VOC domain-containing protein n=1 Tax=Mongoliitalea lutea TaxID=849756 RepID=A0A8J3CYN7_9BACT|nr:VOC family protein [Mongoliitalea lutea]GHB49504.1 hypothetical protein GCM10008106_32780 [Mongoliitalea lutea]
MVNGETIIDPSKEISKSYDFIISGIQQIGIGVENAEAAWDWYKKYFGMDLPVFADRASAKLMTKYTNGKVEDRYAILALNLQGGGGLEIWEYTSRKPTKPETTISLGDLGVFAIKIKSKDVQKTYDYYVSESLYIIGGIQKDPTGKQCFFVHDPFGNLFQIVEHNDWLLESNKLTGGVSGAIIGVSDIDTSANFYKKLIHNSTCHYFDRNTFQDLKGFPFGNQEFKRAFLIQSKKKKGAFSTLLGNFELELIQACQRTPSKIFNNRQWGDLGFIHICFDVNGMDELEKECARTESPFTVNSKNSFDMGKAAGQFAYCEDPDGTLIEFVETHKIPIIEKLKLYFHLKWINTSKPLPRWFFKLMELNKK